MDEKQPYRLRIPLSDVDIDRAGHLRSDEEGLGAARRDSAVRVLLMQAGSPLCHPGGGGKIVRDSLAGPASGGLIWLGGAAFGLGAQGEVFLGRDKDGDPVFAVDMPASFNVEQSPIAGLGEFMEFRGAVQGMTAFEASAAATARAIFEWHRGHGFCANCGAASEIVEAGWKRTCPSCGREHFPRTDPVAIMLAVSGDKALLGRQKSWPAGFWSCLAGFIEPGESIEQGAARELLEEAGIESDPDRAAYLFSQPWPFPSSLMIGLLIDATSEEITVDPNELEDARWFSRDEVALMVAGQHPDAFCPPPMAIAHHILKAWAS